MPSTPGLCHKVHCVDACFPQWVGKLVRRTTFTFRCKSAPILQPQVEKFPEVCDISV